MLDNFGMGEFLMLALFALLFFGPERLPQIGAQLGRWLSKLTSYSKAFMNQWTEEAAAVQGAVQDVMSIRDEIRAAQAEITQTLNAAQQDINDTISVAKGTIREATPTAQGFASTAGGAPALADANEANRFQGSGSSSSGSDDSEAVSKTQDIVNSLLAKQGVLPQETEDETEPEPTESPDGADTSEIDAAASEADQAYQKNLAAIQEIMGRSSKTAPDRGAPPPADKTPTTDAAQDEKAAQAETAQPPGEIEQPVVTQPKVMLPGPIAAGQQAQAESKPKREETESAFDKTQRILNQLMGIEPEPEPEPAVSSESPVQELPQPAPVPDDTPSDEAEAPPSAQKEVAASEVQRPLDAVQKVRSPANGVSMSEFTKLSIEVTLLKRELQTLRKELQSLHAGDGSQGASVEEVA